MSIKNVILVSLGTLSLGLGLLGVVVPLLPTTPFLLLSAALYTRGSPRLHAWLTGHRLLGPYIANYRAGRGIPRRTRIVSITLLWVTIGLSATFAVSHIAARLLLLAIAVGVTVHLLRLR